MGTSRRWQWLVAVLAVVGSACSAPCNDGPCLGSTGAAGTTAGLGGTTGAPSNSGGGSTGSAPCTVEDQSASCVLSTGAAGTCCEGSCVSVKSDSANCGQCGDICPIGSACQDDSCLDDGGHIQSCIDGAVCPPGTGCDTNGEVCVSVACSNSPDDAHCALAGGIGTCCEGACVDVYADFTNCGYCQNACVTGEWCASGACEAVPQCGATNTGQPCPLSGATQGVCCGTACVDSNTDSENCGSCGTVCPRGSTCTGQSCLTDTGLVARCTVDAGCPDGTFCLNRTCSPTECAPQTSFVACLGADGSVDYCCSGECVDPNYSRTNCGSCGVSCRGGYWCNDGICAQAPDCSTAVAGTACPLGAAEGQCCQQGCTDILSDPANCGRCGAVCSVGSICESGVCLGTDGGPSACDLGGSCPSGTECTTVGCLPPSCSGLGEEASCAEGLIGDGLSGVGTCCAGSCTYLGTDPLNCGECETACAEGEWCDRGACAPISGCNAASSGQDCQLDGGAGRCCRGTCADLTADRLNCGTCGAGCSADSSCTLGVCEQTDAGVSDCVLSGCSPGLTCAEGTCAPTSCLIGESGPLCAYGVVEGAAVLGTCCAGACADLLHDPSNCSACGGVCASGVCSDNGLSDNCLPPPAGEDECYSDPDCLPVTPGAVCVQRTCVWPECSGAAQSGALCATPAEQVGACCDVGCQDLLHDPNNCGVCGWVCPADSACVNGACGACAPGSQGQFCADGGGATVCCPSGCADLSTDPSNCGACSARCDGGCEAGRCT